MKVMLKSSRRFHSYCKNIEPHMKKYKLLLYLRKWYHQSHFKAKLLQIQLENSNKMIYMAFNSMCNQFMLSRKFNFMITAVNKSFLKFYLKNWNEQVQNTKIRDFLKICAIRKLRQNVIFKSLRKLNIMSCERFRLSSLFKVYSNFSSIFINFRF